MPVYVTARNAEGVGKMAENSSSMLPPGEDLDKLLFSGAMDGQLPPSADEPPKPQEEPPPPAPEPPKPAAVEPPAPPAPGAPPAPKAGEEHIPAWRLREEAEARRAAEDRNRQLEDHLNRITTHLRQQQPQPGDKPADFFDDPTKVTRQMIQEAMTPYAEETRKNMLYLSKMVAGQVHGADKVETAEQAFLDNMRSGALDPADYERVVTSPNRYDAVVQWHKRQTVLASVGDDPNAWFERQLEAKMADPTFQAKMLEKVRTGVAANGNGGRPAPVELPPTLSGLTSAAPNAPRAVGDMSDASLYSFAMAPEPPKRR